MIRSEILRVRFRRRHYALGFVCNSGITSMFRTARRAW
jgi:hypothetical protein